MGYHTGQSWGLYLFFVYINSINKIGLKVDITLYADDTSLFYFGTSINAIVVEAQNDLDQFQDNLLTINN